jgi:hypothetical protein
VADRRSIRGGCRKIDTASIYLKGNVSSKGPVFARVPLVLSEKDKNAITGTTRDITDMPDYGHVKMLGDNWTIYSSMLVHLKRYRVLPRRDAQ